MRKDGGDATNTMTQHLPRRGSETATARETSKVAVTETQTTVIQMDADTGDWITHLFRHPQLPRWWPHSLESFWRQKCAVGFPCWPKGSFLFHFPGSGVSQSSWEPDSHHRSSSNARACRASMSFMGCSSAWLTQLSWSFSKLHTCVSLIHPSMENTRICFSSKNNLPEN